MIYSIYIEYIYDCSGPKARVQFPASFQNAWWPMIGMPYLAQVHFLWDADQLLQYFNLVILLCHHLFLGLELLFHPHCKSLGLHLSDQSPTQRIFQLMGCHHLGRLGHPSLETGQSSHSPHPWYIGCPHVTMRSCELGSPPASTVQKQMIYKTPGVFEVCEDWRPDTTTER